MTWNKLESILLGPEIGIRALDQFAKTAIAAAPKDHKDALAFFLLGITADRFVEEYRDSPLSVANASARQVTLLAALQEFKRLAGGSDSEKFHQATNFVLKEFSGIMPKVVSR